MKVSKVPCQRTNTNPVPRFNILLLFFHGQGSASSIAGREAEQMAHIAYSAQGRHSSGDGHHLRQPMTCAVQKGHPGLVPISAPKSNRRNEHLSLQFCSSLSISLGNSTSRQGTSSLSRKQSSTTVPVPAPAMEFSPGGTHARRLHVLPRR